MRPFEDELKQALRRQEPAGDFTARVLARCAAEDEKARGGAFWRMFGAWRLAVVGAAVLLTVAGGSVWQQHEREVKGLAAKRQLLLAMRIAGTKLQQVQQRVKESEEVEQ